jgi:indolepyruvate ferredoxin oxidoreductase, beta subunit
MNKDILICGVGGQGTVLASKLIASAAMREGNTVHSAETIGMAQRGGSVTSHVRIGEHAFSPLIPDGKADILLSFEPAEAVRNLKFLKPDGLVIVNTQPVKPITETLNNTGYDGKEMLQYLKSKCKVCIEVDAEELCKPLGSSKFFNIAILGVAAGSKYLGIQETSIIKEIEERVKERFVEVNKKAFAAGMKIGEEYAA